MAREFGLITDVKYRNKNVKTCLHVYKRYIKTLPVLFSTLMSKIYQAYVQDNSNYENEFDSYH